MVPRVSLRAPRDTSRSYRELSFDENSRDDSFAESEDDALSSLPSLPPSPEPASQRRQTTRNRGNAKISYKEDSDDEPATEEVRSFKRKRAAPASVDKTRPSKASKSRKKRQLRDVGAPLRRNKSSTTLPNTQEHATIPTDGVIPSWAILPYEILISIFNYAKEQSSFYYQEDQNRYANWLVGAARVCKAFTEPALAVLYHSPPITSGTQAFQLLHFLSEPSSNRIINYNTRIKKLEMDIGKTLVHSTPGYGAFDPKDLIPYVPQVQTINFHDLYDLPKNRGRRKPYRHQFQDAFFDSLVQNKISLTEWRWTGPSSGTLKLKRSFANRFIAQTSLALRNLRVLTLTDFDDAFFGVSSSPSNTTDTPKFSTMISMLPSLEKIIFRKCMVQESSLKFLPTTLTQLTFSDCDSLDSLTLENFLLSHGSQLTDLTLEHNRNLPLSFLTSLQSACSKLQTFSVNLTYYSDLLSVDQAEPKYYKLLQSDERPTWPSTLRSIEIYYLRHWDLSAAENFFSSLVDSAASLPDLRKLVLTAYVNLDWRDRITFRNTWVKRYNRVFLRESELPNPHLMSLKAFRLWKKSQISEDSEAGPSVQKHFMADSEDSGAPTTTRDRRGRHSSAQQLPTPQPSEGATSFRSLRSHKKAIRAAEESEIVQRCSSLHDRVAISEDYVQGMCDVVDIRIDNLRPRGDQMHEGDFLDSEKSGDEDWIEGQELFGEIQDNAW